MIHNLEVKMVVRAIYEKGLFRPLTPVPELAERCEVLLTIEKPIDLKALQKIRGCVSAEEAEKMQQLIREGRRVEGDW